MKVKIFLIFSVKSHQYILETLYRSSLSCLTLCEVMSELLYLLCPLGGALNHKFKRRGFDHQAELKETWSDGTAQSEFIIVVSGTS